ncbi:hypothetical protein [Tritonibacter mobilis]|uniref:Uncharacterized protein n=1 Tax=Tritonibacter mobilis F1926 TaxID=1265309 RepID=A0A1B1A7L0_9RHOB|nr:hypothetical protein [Tritonibacter mobilis]ANP42562.1 hypothetical protein K529_017475 [Tritonibacter mobilis F1926]
MTGGLDGTLLSVANLPEDAFRGKEPGNFGVLIILQSRVGEVLSNGFDPFGSILRFHWGLIFAMIGSVSTFGDVPDGDGCLRQAIVGLTTRALQQKQERQVMGEDNHLSIPALAREPFGDGFPVEVIERGNRIIKDDRREPRTKSVPVANGRSSCR